MKINCRKSEGFAIGFGLQHQCASNAHSPICFTDAEIIIVKVVFRFTMDFNGKKALYPPVDLRNTDLVLFSCKIVVQITVLILLYIFSFINSAEHFYKQFIDSVKVFSDCFTKANIHCLRTPCGLLPHYSTFAQKRQGHTAPASGLSRRIQPMLDRDLISSLEIVYQNMGHREMNFPS